MVPGNTPEEFIMLCGILAYGACAAVYPGWREETFELLAHYATSANWRVREGVVMAYQHLLTAELQETVPHLFALATEGGYLQQRAAIASVAEPELLYNRELLTTALEIQRIILERTHSASVADRKTEDFRTLRKALGYTLSVITAAAPEEGFALMRECASWQDADITRALRENLKKKRLAKFVEETAEVAKLLA
jgi:hypothetical protein